jgi:acyl-CoA thioester hydrolase
VTGYRRSFPTRWNDNDVYGHVNNAVYYEAMDTTINTWLIAEGGLDIEGGDVIGICAASNCRYTASGSFPDALAVDLSVGRLGNTSITWRLRISREADDEELATGEFVHVFVDRESRRPASLPAALRSAVEARLEVAA